MSKYRYICTLDKSTNVILMELLFLFIVCVSSKEHLATSYLVRILDEGNAGL